MGWFNAYIVLPELKFSSGVNPSTIKPTSLSNATVAKIYPFPPKTRHDRNIQCNCWNMIILVSYNLSSNNAMNINFTLN